MVTGLLIAASLLNGCVVPVQVFIAAGASNSFGRADTDTLTDTSLLDPFPLVKMAEQLECPDDDGVAACDVQTGWADLDTHSDDPTTMGVLPSFGRQLHLRLAPLGPIRVINVGTSGSSFPADWDPDLVEGRVLYSRLVAYVAARVAEIPEDHEVAGFAWIQGEEDANTDVDANAYAANLDEFFTAVWTEYGVIPTAIVRLSSQSGKQPARLAAVRAAQEAFVAGNENAVLVNVDDLSLIGVHFTADGYNTVGVRLADALATLIQSELPMSIQLSVAARNARLDAIETAIGTSAVLAIFTGGQPASCAAADSGTELARMTLPSDWLAAAASGSKAKSGTWQDTAANATGTAGHFRVYASDGTTCHVQGTVTATGGGGDLTLDDITVTAGQQVTITSFALTDANA